MEQSDPILPSGTVLFNEYEIVQEIGSGGMGRVYSARHRSMDELRAIKVVRRGSGLDAKQEELLIREAKSLIKMSHDGVVRCHELLRDDRGLYLVMEFVEGPSLQRILLQGPLPDDEVRLLRKRLLEALAAIHGQGVTHRDISPSNIILPDGDPAKAKVVDFGLAGVGGADGKKGFQGNPVYASPEQFGLFGGKVEAQSDLYSLGLVLTEATMGEPLPMGETQNERQAFRKVRPVLPDYVPVEIRREILPLLEPDPKNRPADARAALNARAAVEKTDPVNEGEEWLAATIFLATAIGVGIGLGFVFWAWKNTRLLAEAPYRAPVPVVSTGPVKQVVAGNPPKPSPPPLPPVLPSPAAAPAKSGTVTRAQVIAEAERLVGHEWVPAMANLEAKCKLQSPYRTTWHANVSVKGVPYCWGGMDGPDGFDRKLQQGLAAGSHSYHGIAPCTAGIDCSGFVIYCWGMRGGHAYTTRTLHEIAPRLKGNVKTDLKPGDALNWPGKHVVLFGGYLADGRPLIYEASGAYSRVVKRDDMTWAQLKKYHPVRYAQIGD